MMMEVVENICEAVGEVQKSARAVNEEGGNFVRVRVKVDITCPCAEEGLLPWRMVRRSGCNLSMNACQIFFFGMLES